MQRDQNKIYSYIYRVCVYIFFFLLCVTYAHVDTYFILNNVRESRTLLGFDNFALKF